MRDGDVVKAGQTLFRLDDIQARVTLDRLRGRVVAARALEARLIAGQDDAADIIFPASLTANGANTANAETLAGQVKIFVTRKESLAGQQSILRQQTIQLNEEIGGLNGLICAEISDVQSLVRKGLAKRSRLLALQRLQAEIEGARSRNIAAVARAKQQVAESGCGCPSLRLSA